MQQRDREDHLRKSLFLGPSCHLSGRGPRRGGAQWLDLTKSESPEFIGRAVAALAADPDVLRHSGEVLVAARVAIEYGFTDIDGKIPRPLTLADV